MPKKLSRMILAALILILGVGGLVGFIVIAILLPIFKMSSAIR